MTTHSGVGHFRVHFWPTRPFGRWSIGSAAILILGQVAFWLAVLAGQDRGEAESSFFDNWWLAAPALVMVAGGLSALVSGVLAMIREHDRSIGVILSTVLGLLLALFLVFGE
jgi:hypothetical protein